MLRTKFASVLSLAAALALAALTTATVTPQSPPLAAAARSAPPGRDYPVQPVPFTAVHLTDVFWAPRIETNRKVTIPAAFEKCEETGRVNNFERAHPHTWAGKERWVNERNDSHELYDMGHLFEAAAAHYQATGKKNFLNVATRAADLLVNTFGPGKRSIWPGHQITEMGLVKLYRVTGREQYLT